MSCVSDILHHSHQNSYGVCEIFVLEYQQLKNETRFEMLSMSLLDPLNWVAMRLICANIIEESCPSGWRHPISLELSGLVIAAQDRWWRRICWQPVYNLSSCLLYTWSLSLWHAVCLSSVLWHSQWYDNVWNDDSSIMPWCSLVDGRLYWWSEGHAEHIDVGAEDHYGCICQFLLIRSIHPKPGSLCQLWHLSHREWWACNLGVVEITLSRSS